MTRLQRLSKGTCTAYLRLYPTVYYIFVGHVFFLSACGSASTNPQKPVISSIQLTPTKQVISVGSTQPFLAIAKDSTGAKIDGVIFSWKSNDVSLATIDNAGLVDGIKSGATEITATADGASASASVEIIELPTVSPILVTPSQAKIKPGGSQLFSAFSIDTPGSVQSTGYQWSSDNQAVVTIDNNGLAKAVAAGTAQLTTSLEGITQSATLKVESSAPRPIEIVDLTPEEESTVELAHCQTDLGCPLISEINRINSLMAKFIFYEGDVFEAVELLIDGSDITSQAKVITDSKILDPNVQGELIWDRLFDLPAGAHRANVTVKSKAGKTVSYDWNFIVARESGIRGTISKGPICPVLDPSTVLKCQEEPLYQATVIVKDEQGAKEITRFTSNVYGQFRVALDPGTYLLNPLPGGDSRPFARPETVVVLPDQFTDILIGYDTGLR